jgi:hypothetical protein
MSTCYHGESRSRVQNRMPELLAETGQATSSADVEQTQTAIARMARPLFWFGEVHCPIIVSSSSQQAAYMYALGADRRDASRSSLRVHICRSTCIKGNGLHAIEHVYIRYVRTVKLYPSTSHYTGTNGIIDPRQGPNKQQMNHYTGPSIFCGIIGPYDIRMQSGLTNLSRSIDAEGLQHCLGRTLSAPRIYNDSSDIINNTGTRLVRCTMYLCTFVRHHLNY